MDQNRLNEAMSAVALGDTESFGPVYDAYIDRIYRFVYYKTHHRETAEDLTSEVFAKALRSASSFDSGKGGVTPWLYRIARNTVVDHYRRSRSTESIEDAWDLSSGEDVARDVEMRVSVEEVREHLSALTADQRDVVLMRLWEGMSHAEIAEALGKSEASCKMAYSRGLKRLRDSMGLLALIVFLTQHL